MVDEKKCDDCGTRYAANFGHDCPKKKKQGQEQYKQGRYLVKSSATISGVMLAVEFRVFEKDDVKGGMVEAFYLVHSTIGELVQKGIER